MRWRMWQAFWGVGAMVVHIFSLGSTRNKYLENQTWGIGQYLAVATWIPALLKMGYIVNVGAEIGLSASLPRPWIALMIDDNPENEQRSTLASICSRGASLMGLPTSAFTLGRRRDTDDTSFGIEEGQTTGVIQITNESNEIRPREDKVKIFGTTQELEAPVIKPRRRGTDDTLVGDVIEPVLDDFNDKQDNGKIVEESLQMFEEPEEVEDGLRHEVKP
nr:uncharacterized protein CTRU02_03622 [Colletotrichum truncatum]KAF6796644.1 hypothetical protein CTRU02_03622 [Colletotrichum truncatum]